MANSRADVLIEHPCPQPSEPAEIDSSSGQLHAGLESFESRVAELLPDGGNLSLCLSCGSCAANCPATGLDDMDPRKFLRMASLGMDAEVTSTPWVWKCSMCMRCVYNCPMKINIPQLVYNARQAWPREKRPRGIIQSCDAALNNNGNSAMGASSEDFGFVVGDVLEEVIAELQSESDIANGSSNVDLRPMSDEQLATPEGFALAGRQNRLRLHNLQAPMDKVGAYYFLNQNSREPVTEPEEMAPLWKILQLAGADWTYSSSGWAAENYCLFAADDRAWESIVRNKADAVRRLKSSVWLNTE